MEKSTQDIVIGALSAVLGIEKDQITQASTLQADLSMDPLDYDDIMDELEDQLEIDIDDEDFWNCKTVADVIAYCEKLDRQPEDA